MSTLINASIKASELKKIDKNKIIKGEKDSYIPILISVNDESRFGKNVSISIQQSEDERKNKAPKHFIANGSVIWTDGKIVKGQKDGDGGQPQKAQTPFVEDALGDDDLPF